MDFLDSLKDIKKELIKEQRAKEEGISQESKEASLRKEFADFVKDSDLLRK